MKPLVLRTPKKSHWLVLEGDRYRPIAPQILRTRLRELGLGWCCDRVGGGNLRPREIVEAYGATLSAEHLAAHEERGKP